METMDVTDAMLSQTEGEEEDTMDMQTANRVAVDETAVVTEGMTITGDIVSQGSMELGERETERERKRDTERERQRERERTCL